MIALEVKLNGKLVALAGREDLSVLNATINAAGVLGEKSSGTKKETETFHLSLDIGGLSSNDCESPNEHLRWESLRPVCIGDEITVKVMESNLVEGPTSVKKYDQKRDLSDERDRWEICRDYYFKHKEHFEENG